MTEPGQPRVWQCGSRALVCGGQPLVMGILNVTTDSFSDGGRYLDVEAAVAHGLRMVADGAAIIDVGGESTRPGAVVVPSAEEERRVAPVVAALAARTSALISVDTRKAVVARAALAAGACIVNDVSALTYDPAMAGVARETGAGVVLMHLQGTPQTMQDDPRYDDVAAEVAAYLAARLAAAVAAGLRPAALAVDPGIGFGKTVDHNLALLRALPRFGAAGRPVVVGVSRKRFLGALTGRPPEERLAGGLAAAAWCAWQGADVLRVHDVRPTCDALRVIMALKAQDGHVG